MSARLPLLHKTPFVLDPRPLSEATSPHAGLLSVSRAYRSLGVPALVAANLSLRKRQRGFSEAQLIEAICLLQAVGGECPEDMPLLAGDPCLERGLGYSPPKATAAREFLERFHDQKLEQLRPKREDQKSFIFPSSEPVAALQEVQSGLVRRIAKLYDQAGRAQRIATVDQDAMDLTPEPFQLLNPGHLELFVQQALGPGYVLDPGKTVISLFVVQTRLVHLAGQPVPTVETNIDQKGKPGL